jgi:hypothetical protein
MTVNKSFVPERLLASSRGDTTEELQGEALMARLLDQPVDAAIRIG